MMPKKMPPAFVKKGKATPEPKGKAKPNPFAKKK